ncbi:MAG: phosphoenolpyruvate synthase/pyruvate phosphate dikinase, partial [Candidatus Hydrogenedentes bacterium]|nr:phosphoenolpyruvate synthase/pyruvate phosphate dikinase [Candidatus Hydrogenedentota bacterium]
ALLKVRNEMGLTNVKLMVPFCRTPEEGRRVIEVMREFGLVQGEEGLEIYVMCEIPSNVVSAEAFSDVFDGFSIGSNDLIQYLFAIDRNNERIAADYDPDKPVFWRLLQDLADAARDADKPLALCGEIGGQPQYLPRLIELGIDCTSVSPRLVGLARVAARKHLTVTAER